MQVHGLEVLILYTAPCLYSGLSLSLTLVTGSRKVVIGLCAMRALEQVRYSRCRNMLMLKSF